MKRFTETDKWRDPWFRSLPAPAKLVFFYMIDNCNNAGFHELDQELMVMLTGMRKEHVEGALKALERGIIGPIDGWYWVRRFLRHQKNEDLNPSNPAHKQIISLIKDQSERFETSEEFNAFLAPLKGLLSPIGKGKGTGIGKGESEERGRFSPPDISEVLAYGKEIGMASDSVQAWFDHFQANGWKVGGKAAMKDWQAALRNGKRREPTFSRNGTPTTASVTAARQPKTFAEVYQ